jgi:hypothetical protein
MSRSGLVDMFTYGAWYKFSKDYIDKYKREHDGKELPAGVAETITFNTMIKPVSKLVEVKNDDGTVSKKLVTKNTTRIPEIEDVLTLMRAANPDNFDIDKAIKLLEVYFNNPDNKNKGMMGAIIDLCCDFYNDLNLIPGAYKRCLELKDKYEETLKEIDKPDTEEDGTEDKKDQTVDIDEDTQV